MNPNLNRMIPLNFISDVHVDIRFLSRGVLSIVKKATLVFILVGHKLGTPPKVTCLPN